MNSTETIFLDRPGILAALSSEACERLITDRAQCDLGRYAKLRLTRSQVGLA